MPIHLKSCAIGSEQGRREKLVLAKTEASATFTEALAETSDESFTIQKPNYALNKGQIIEPNTWVLGQNSCGQNCDGHNRGGQNS